MQDAQFTIRNGLYSIEFRVIRSGSDVVLHLDGGDRPHVGAVSLATYDEEENCTTAKTLVVGNHREDDLTERVASVIAQELRCTAAVVAGIHFDQLDRAGIDAIRRLADEAGLRAIAWIQRGDDQQ